MGSIEEDRIDITFIKNKFKEIHNDYNKYFKTFYKKLDSIFKETDDYKIKHNDLLKIIDWYKEYENIIDCTKQTLEDFENQIRNKSLDLTNERISDNQIFSEVKDKIMPIAIVYWTALRLSGQAQ